MAKKKKQQADWSARELNPNAAEERKERERKMLARVGFRKVDMEQEALERQADEILRKADHDMLKAIAENVQVLCEGFAQLKLPSNDPHYLSRLQGIEAARDAIASKINQIDIVPDGVKSYLGLGSFNHADARELALLLSSHFEAKIRQHE